MSLFNTADHKNGHLNGVSCTVATCQYHGMSNCCNAEQIKVGTEYAQDKADTFCSTFEQKPEIF